MVVGTEGVTDRRRAVEISRRFHECSDDVDPDDIAGWIHEDAQMSLVMTHFTPIRGRKAIMEVLFRRRESLLYDAKVDSCDWLDDSTLLTRGHARYALPDRGVTHSTVWWLDEFRDELLWRVHAFVEEAEARQAHEESVDLPLG